MAAFRWLAAILSANCILAACAAPMSSAPVAEKSVLIAPADAPVKTVQLARFDISIPASRIVGRRTTGFLCLGGNDLRMGQMDALVGRRELVDIFEQEFESANYKVVGNPDALFADARKETADLMIGILIKNVEANICFPSEEYNLASGNAKFMVQWQIYDRLQRETILTVDVTGSSEVSLSSTAPEESFRQAFASSVRQLLASQEFFDVVTGRREATRAAAIKAQDKKATVSIATVPLSTKPFETQATDIRGRVATILTGEGSGSGFMIADRYFVTNQHVVGGAAFVKVKLITGREILGDVIARDVGRDVALIQTEPVGLGGLPIRLPDVAIGSRVFVVGSPLGEDNEGTVLSGIVSTYRVDDDGTRYIQSDAGILPGNSGGPMLDESGNVIAITVAGIIDPRTGGSTGLNYFIPIAEALEKLGVTLAGPNS
ncbi:MAG: serine protease [Rhodobacteraceae bacterium]|nr:serine protease [Paracoccaceae bacterium]